MATIIAGTGGWEGGGREKGRLEEGTDIKIVQVREKEETGKMEDDTGGTR